MGNYLNVHLPVLLEPNGTLAPMLGKEKRLAEYCTQIVSEATNYDEPTTLRCRRRPGRKPCTGVLHISFDDQMKHDIWVCPICNDRGLISGWRDTFWDYSNLTDVTS
jgi:hypothetical protein